MYVTFARSSSVQNLSYCQLQYFLTYNLGLYAPANHKALLGTTVHKCLEILALGKQYVQNNPDATQFEIEGYKFDTNTWLKSYTLDDDEVDAVNKSRINKQVYLVPAPIKYGHTRYGVKLVKQIIDGVCAKYAKTEEKPWAKVDYMTVENWVWMLLDYMKGSYDPRKRNIVEPEWQFEYHFDEDWAQYEYEIKGQKIAGSFGIKGTIDFITEVSPDTYEVIDYKTGQRLDWATGERKTLKKLEEDFQLMLYYYALKKKFPDKNIIVTIFFIRDGGPFTITFDENILPKVALKLKKHFEDVKAIKIPRMLDKEQKDFRCAKLCHFKKNEWEHTGQNICRFMYNEINKTSLEKVVEKYQNPQFSLGQYQAPGGE